MSTIRPRSPMLSLQGKTFPNQLITRSHPASQPSKSPSKVRGNPALRMGLVWACTCPALHHHPAPQPAQVCAKWGRYPNWHKWQNTPGPSWHERRRGSEPELEAAVTLIPILNVRDSNSTSILNCTLGQSPIGTGASRSNPILTSSFPPHQLVPTYFRRGCQFPFLSVPILLPMSFSIFPLPSCLVYYIALQRAPLFHFWDMLEHKIYILHFKFLGRQVENKFKIWHAPCAPVPHNIVPPTAITWHPNTSAGHASSTKGHTHYLSRTKIQNFKSWTFQSLVTEDTVLHYCEVTWCSKTEPGRHRKWHQRALSRYLLLLLRLMLMIQMMFNLDTKLECEEHLFKWMEDNLPEAPDGEHAKATQDDRVLASL